MAACLISIFKGKPAENINIVIKAISLLKGLSLSYYCQDLFSAYSVLYKISAHINGHQKHQAQTLFTKQQTHEALKTTTTKPMYQALKTLTVAMPLAVDLALALKRLTMESTLLYPSSHWNQKLLTQPRVHFPHEKVCLTKCAGVWTDSRIQEE